MRFLITGGAGLIGSHIADLLVREQRGAVVVLDNFSRGRRENLQSAVEHGQVTVVDGDILHRGSVAAAMRDVDVVFHLAALRLTQCAEDPRLALHVLADGTFNVVEAAVAAGVSRFVLSSSASVYGLATEFPTPETHHPYDNRTIYGAAKLFNEGILRSFHDTHGFDYLALRYFNVYGPRMDAFGAYTEVLVRWMERIDAGLPPQIFGDGEQTMDFVYVEDVARANVLAAAAAATDEVLNIGSGVETSLNDLAHRLLQTMGSSLGVEYRDARPVNPVLRRLAEMSRAKSLIGFTPSVDLDRGLVRLVEWWRRERQAHVPTPA